MKSRIFLRCFICGEGFQNYEEYKDHIFEEHSDEEWNMWIRCPHCDFPIRDVRSHYKSKHPGLEVPKLKQMKARIWKEWNPKSKKMERSKKTAAKSNWKQGFFESKKNSSRKFKYRSSWELYVMECLEVFDEVLTWDSESIMIPYNLLGKQRLYIPDLLITYKQNSHMLVEIKPKNQCEEEMNKAKWAAAKIYCDARRWRFEVWTENYIQQLQRRRRSILENTKLTKLNPGIEIL